MWFLNVTKYYSSFDSFEPLKNVKTILSLWVTQNPLGVREAFPGGEIFALRSEIWVGYLGKVGKEVVVLRMLEASGLEPLQYVSGVADNCAQSCPTLCDPMDHSPPGSFPHGILQARILQWVAISYSRGIFPTQGSNPCLLCLLHILHRLAGRFFTTVPSGKPQIKGYPWLCKGNINPSKILRSYNSKRNVFDFALTSVSQTCLSLALFLDWTPTNT